ncbi:MAG: type 2 isopentenyl-diphosphate Delta-isomerase [Candidatus Aenigmarchaeota archaeon]|nr:type 2 isopentenyl-diphosphate Delta-isomerase [Candidatus Aenigmarchaeota archaeon]
MDIKTRKDDHIRICLEEEVEHRYNYWDDIILKHHALPDFDFVEVSSETTFLGKKLGAPILIGAISGGIEKAGGLNEMLAKSACERKIGLCIGSQRPLLKLRGDKDALKSYSVVKNYDLPLVIGNIGAPQLPALCAPDTDLLFESIGADFLAVHLNYPQEIAQPEGDLNARGVLEKICEIAKSYPVIVKEVGFGISGEVALKLKDAGVKAIDVSGTSGTNWVMVEYYRSKSVKSKRKMKIAETFRNWGIPAPICLTECRKTGLPLIASSGIRNGLDAAKALTVGASAVSIARPILKAAMAGKDALDEYLDATIEELKIAMFLTNSVGVKDLRKAKFWTVGKLKEII